MASNLIVIASIVLFYSFIVWGIGSVYGTEDSYEVDQSGNYSLGVGFTDNIFGVSTYQSDCIPPLVNLFVITPLNFLLVGAVFFFIRGVA